LLDLEQVLLYIDIENQYQKGGFMDLKSKLHGFLEKNGLKKTKERDNILGLMASIKEHFDADKIYEQALRTGISASRASIYRTILLFKDAGILNESIRKDGKAVYELSSDKAHHDHMICIKCGKIEEFSDDVIEKHQEKICGKYGFQITEHRLEIKGICRKCR
jgi:Fur family ferric uptake transcriptional regulator